MKLKETQLFYLVIMHQSVPAVNVLPGDHGDSQILFVPPPPGFSLKGFARGLGFRSGQFFPKLTKIYSVFLFLVSGLRRLLRTAGKNACFFFTVIAFVSYKIFSLN